VANIAPPAAPADDEAAHLRRSQVAWKDCQKAYYAMDFSLARPACEQALAEVPGRPDVLVGLGWIELEIGDSEAALTSASDAIVAATKEGERADANVLKAAALTVLDRHREAEAALKAAVAHGYKGNEAKSRLAILRGEGIPSEWLRHILPRHACWSRMGAPAAEPGSCQGKSCDFERPVHEVAIKAAFCIGSTEVTQGEWKAVMGNNPSNFQGCGDRCPVESVRWWDAVSFCNAMKSFMSGGITRRTACGTTTERSV